MVPTSRLIFTCRLLLRQPSGPFHVPLECLPRYAALLSVKFRAELIHPVTGASRGVGLALVQQLAQKSNNIVVAAVRDINLHTDHPLSRLITEKPKSVVLVNLSSAIEEEHIAVAAMMEERFGKVDVIIANAGPFRDEASASRLLIA